jgi:hypothetical protein
VRDLLVDRGGSALVCFDFPYGFPRSSGPFADLAPAFTKPASAGEGRSPKARGSGPQAGLGGGRRAAAFLHERIRDRQDGSNNRFEAAAALNATLNDGRPGPFWGCPESRASPTLTRTLRGLEIDRLRFPEYRIVEERLRERGRHVQSVWKLAYPGSVGSQTLLGLPAVHGLLSEPALARRSLVWPFETGWGERLTGVVHAEIWPSLRDSSAQPHGIKDARQVMELREWACEEDARSCLRRWFARPEGLTNAQAEACQREEGWILGVD